MFQRGCSLGWCVFYLLMIRDIERSTGLTCVSGIGRCETRLFDVLVFFCIRGYRATTATLDERYVDEVYASVRTLFLLTVPPTSSHPQTMYRRVQHFSW
ncbi:hypothetical protein BDV95DRAFT_108634 [Massariosphaeria phaeospora]|uniref:Secreted protein n=1 Tax=Massariosphaeria phaeospora TaxID=100035 RepID=A0A7C8I298_9PLEO|nr:hypothetical protein BDV95DRAFT_108634 [Massariosphaeria phaeospora]